MRKKSIGGLAPLTTTLLAAGLLARGSQAGAAKAAPKAGAAAADGQEAAQHKKAPNVLIILLDDAGFAQPDTFGGEIHTPTLSRIARTGVTFNNFNVTGISSATRAALLTGRNHHHVGNGTITEAAVEAYEGYTGVIPANAATIPQVLKQAGYASAAFGKWHNTPALEAGPRGPFDHWPTAYGFDHFYGFLGGESDQYRPRLFDDTKAIEPPRDPHYHLTEDITAKAIGWLDHQHAQAPGKPFFLYWAPGAVHAPHQVFAQWSDKYKGKFDGGWDAYRQRAYERQKALGWIPKDTVNNPRPEGLPAWDSLGAEEKAFQARLMEVYAGFLEHTDAQAGKLVDELERLGLRDDTLVFYVFTDNGASAEGMKGTINDLLGLNGIARTPQDDIKTLNQRYGGLKALGGPLLGEHYSAAWAWAGESPFVGTKLVAGYFGATRSPLAVSWPGGLKAEKAIRTQFHHVNDLAPTIYEAAGIQAPAQVAGVKQEPLDGVSLLYAAKSATAAGRKGRQYFEIMGSRAEVADGWAAAVFGPRVPWIADQSHLVSWAGKASYILKQPWFGDHFGWMAWDPEKDHWSLYDLRKDFSESKDVGAEHPDKLAELKAEFDQDAKANHVYPVGAGFYRFLRLEKSKQTEWHFPGDYTRQPELAVPNIRSQDNTLTVDADFPAHAHGVLFKLGQSSGGITLFLEDGKPVYEYNAFSVERTQIRSDKAVPAGHATVSVQLKASWRRAGPATAILSINGQEVGRAKVPFTAPLVFTATGTFDVGRDLGSAVSLDYLGREPFAFNGSIHDVAVRYE
jgi:arylsulfatase